MSLGRAWNRYQCLSDNSDDSDTSDNETQQRQVDQQIRVTPIPFTLRTSSTPTTPIGRKTPWHPTTAKGNPPDDEPPTEGRDGRPTPTPISNASIMGTLPQVFTGNRTLSDDFMEEVKGYLRLNQDVPGFNSPIKRVALTLTLIQGPEVAGWKRDMD